MRVIRWLLCVVALTAGALGGNQPDTPKPDAPQAPSYPNIILITIDTTRADRMGFLGSRRGLTPHLDEVARQSAVFTRAYSQAPFTPTSHATVLTGTYPQYHQVLNWGTLLRKDIPYMPDILKAHGYTTAAFVGSIALDPGWAVPGFERGFDTYDSHYSREGYSPKTRYQTTERRGGEVVARALAWLSQHQQGPFFLWVHLFDPHEPYDPPEPYKTRYAKAPYDGEIAYVDSALGKFFSQLKASGLYDGALIAMTADHGESLGAHGEDQHGIFVYDETIHVPLFIKLPHGQAAGKRVEDTVELADIMPTLLETAGIEVPKEVQGTSLGELMKPGPEGEAAAQAWRDRGAYSEADYGHLAFGWSALQSLRTEKYTYIQAPRRELYDSAVDAKAQHNLASASPAVADTLSARLEVFRQKTTNARQAPKADLDAASMKKLAVLGYMGYSSESSLSASTERGADPKDKIQIANTILRISSALQDFRCDKAMPQLQKALRAYPSTAMLHFFMGGCYLEKKDYEKAVPELRQTVKLDPGFTHAEMTLGRALMEMADYEGAVTTFEHIEATAPQIMYAHIFLIVGYARTNRVQDGIRECRTVLQSIPDNFGANLNLGRFLLQSGDLEGAIPPLQKAATVRPDRPGPHIYLSDVYARLGREEDAKREKAEADRLRALPNRSPDATPDDKPDSDLSKPE